jgi:mannitol-1-phosphate 5-dehydrogenase
MMNTPKKAVQFGAGNIGRAFIGVLLSQAGYCVVFADVVEPLIDHINQDGQYTIKSVTGTEEKLITVEHVRAINSRAEAEVVEEISQATLITTAVGPNVLRFIAPTIAKGLQRRAELNISEPLAIIACENLIDNSKILAQYVRGHLAAPYHEYVEQHVGFPSCVIDMVVTSPSEQEREENPLLLVAEGHGLLIVDQNGFIGEPPLIEGMELTNNLAAYVEQKIFTLNTAHAITAYLGYIKGHQFIHQAIQDPTIRPIVLGALDESSASLVERHQLDPTQQKNYVDSVLVRFENSTLPDPVVRVAREPKRKLAATDRLIKPALLTLEAGITPTNLATGIAAALLYDEPSDQQALALSQALKEKGIDQVLNDVCDLSADDLLTNLVKQKMQELLASKGKTT